MKHIVALLIKYTAITAVLLIMLSIFQGISIPRVLLISLFLTGTAYLIGDLFILPKYGNAIATMADFGLSFFGIWLLTSLFTNLDATHNIGFSSFIAALIIGGTEVFFHIYMKRLVLRNDDKLTNHNHIQHNKYAIEMSDEYIDSSTINKSKLKDTSKKLKSGQRHFFIFVYYAWSEFLTCNGGGTTHPFFLLKRSRVTPACAFFI
ncbi:DUF2512 family protein [Bacillus thuringiensis]|nr:DUF2512 family protein [Bacillus thuringiensis]